MSPLDPPESGHMRVDGHLPFSWRRLKQEEAEAVRSHIMDQAVARSWKSRPEGHVSVSEELAPIIRRLNELDEKMDRVLKRLERPDIAEQPIRALTLGTESCTVAPLPGEELPKAGEWTEIRFCLPPEDDEEMVVLTRFAGNGIFNFVTIAQDQADHLVRYLLNRQRLAQNYPPL